MRNLSVLSFFLFLPVFFYSQSSYWMQGIGGNNVDESMGVCKDPSGNYITAGYYSNTAYFTTLTTSLTATSVGIPDIYVQKTAPSGNVVWQVSAGGSGTDRAVAVACDNSGNIYITGFFYGNATFGSITLSSSNGSQDAFVAKLNSSGVFQWAKSAGGNLSEWGNSIGVDNSGNVYVTGQFKGTCSWGAISKSSMTNPSTGQPSFDVYTAKYDANGNEVWVETGSGEFDDRGLDLSVDVNGNVYVCGQFSDTATFGVIHNNPVMNAVFLIKYNTNGVEQWFRRASASYALAYALCLDNQQNIYLTGDFKGNMVFYGSPNNFVNSTYTNSFFIAKYTTSGNFLWADGDGSDSYLSSRDCAVDAQNNVYLEAEFGCVMDEYSAQYGPGIFNSIGYQDILCVKYSDTGSRLWFKQVGGPGNDKAHGIVLESLDKPVMTGSYESRLGQPVSGNIVMATYCAILNQWGVGPQGISQQLCNDNYYFDYMTIKGAGFSDGFLLNGMDLTREPYDYYNHYAATCQRDFVGTCVTTYPSYFTCSDTIEVCANGKIFANTNTGSQGFIGPYHSFEWNTGTSDTLQYLDVFASGIYSVKVQTRDGCFSDTDSVYVLVHPLPHYPKITDELGFNINQPPATDTVLTCYPDTVTLSVSNLQGCSITWSYNNGNNYSWSPYLCYGGTPVGNSDSVDVFQKGFYTATLTDSFGCSRCNSVWVKIDSIISIAPKTNFPDTVVACYGDGIIFYVYDSISNPTGNPIYCLGDFNTTWITSPNFTINDYQPQCTMHGMFYATMPSGTYTITEMIIKKNVCQNDTFWVTKTFYIQVNPLPQANINVTGSTFLCPGDTLVWQASVSGTPSNALITMNPPPGTIYITAPGWYAFNATITDTATGCFHQAYLTKNVLPKPDPVITTVPPNAIICPNDSALLTCNLAGTNYEWHGPNGLLSPVTQSIFDSVPGFYHCVVTDMSGCVLTSNTVELREYSTPYLEANPSSVICNGQAVTLNVITLDSSGIQWLSPLWGSAPSQVVTTAGVYQCNVSMCGITTQCSVTVLVSNPSAVINTTNTILCPGDSTVLTAGSGPYSYNWAPGSSADPSITAYGPGTYSLTVTDANGCQASSSINITLNNSTPQPTIASSYTVCYNDSALVTASAGGLPIEWYADQNLFNQIGSGNTYATSALTANTTIYASAVGAGGCNSAGTPVSITVNNASALPSISGDTLVCAGSTINLLCASTGSFSYSWSGPSGYTSSSQNPVIINATAANSGTYSLFTSGGGCTSPSASWSVIVVAPQQPQISGSDTLCASDDLVLYSSVNPGGTISWFNGFGFNIASGDSVTLFAPVSSGWYSAQQNISGCLSTSDSFYVEVFSNPAAPGANVNSPLCAGDTAFLFADTIAGLSYNWTGPNGFTSSNQNPVIANVQTINSGIYNLIAFDGYCFSTPATVSLQVNPIPEFNLGNDTIICEDDELILNAGSGFTSYLWENGLTTQTYSIHFPGLFSVTVTDSMGCSSTDSIAINYMSCRPQLTNVFTPNGDGLNDKFFFAGELFQEVKCSIWDRWGIVVYEWDGTDGSWDGTNMNSGKPVSEGTYYYIAEVLDKEHKKNQLHGYITLSR